MTPRSTFPRMAAASAVAALSLAPLTASPAHAAGAAFANVATFDVIAGNGSAVAEIIDVTMDGNTLIYTDADNGEIGFVDITDSADPVAGGTVSIGGEPTSLAVLGDLVVVATNTSPDFVDPSGELVVVDVATRAIVETFALGGQPDSIAVAPDGARLAVVIENERDEDLNGGLLPQNDTGGLLIFDVSGPPSTWTSTQADLGPVVIDAFAGADLEPEFVDINDRNLAVVTFQENNHLAVVDMTTGETISQFSAGSVDLSDVDTVEDDLITLDSSITKRREPDAVAWIDDDSFATANEGDYEDADGEQGGSRGFTVFGIDGTIEYESAESFEHALVAAGQYPEGRSENKGVEPESIEFGSFGQVDHLFVGAERANAVGVYEIGSDGPVLTQVLPTGIGPEGLKAIPSRDLFVVSTESDEEDDGIPTMINIYGLTDSAPGYPDIVSGADPASSAGTPIPWVALSGLVGDPVDPSTLFAVSDSFLAKGFVYEIDVSSAPATIVDRLEVTGASTSLDLEGIAIADSGNLWLASEGNDDRPNLLVEVDPGTGLVVAEVGLPTEFDDIRTNGFEGIAVDGDVVYVAVQRAWPGEGDTDEANTKIGRYDTASGSWSFVHYPLESETDGGWIGLSELTLLPDGTFAVVERDKGWGPSTEPNASLKAVFQVDLANAPFAPYRDGVTDGGLATISKRFLIDVVPALSEASIFTPEKLEGLAVSSDGQVYAVTDNDGVDDATGETIFLGLGDIAGLLGPDPEIPEVPMAALLSLTAAMAIGGFVVWDRRRRPAIA